MSKIRSGRLSRQSVARSSLCCHSFGGKHHGGWGLPNVKRGEGLFIMFHVHAKFSMMHGVLYISVPYLQGSSSKDYNSWCSCQVSRCNHNAQHHIQARHNAINQISGATDTTPHQQLPVSL